MKPAVLIVDGYNVIGSWDGLKSLKERNLGSARDQLIDILAAYYPWSWQRIIVAFDGRSFDWDDSFGVEVVFTGPKESADTMIERLAAGLVLRHQVTVATSDCAERIAAANYGAEVLSAPALKEELAARRNEYSRRLAASGQAGINFNELLSEKAIALLERLRNAAGPREAPAAENGKKSELDGQRGI